MIIFRAFSLCILILFIYIPGLSGGFLFDDFANLDALGKYGGINNLGDLWSYLSKGIAGPGGRPISLLSFLANATQWPTDPWPFKVTNLFLHIAVALTLYWLIYRLILLLSGNEEAKRAMNIAWLATAIWALHPFFVSTTLYVIQRMTILAALFVIIGLLTYVHGRSLLQRRPKAAYLWMTLGLGINTILAVLSKENGALLPLFALTIEYCVFRHQKQKLPPLSKSWEIPFLWIPASAPFIYFYYKWPGILNGYNRRGFTLEERLLTESRVMVDYLYHLFVPKIQTRGLFNDNFQISTTLATPSVLFSITIITLLMTIGLLLRKRQPFISLGIVFFFAGHILESTIIALEIYFEHRNYLPAVFLFLPLAIGIQKLTNKNRIIGGASTALMIIIITTFTATRSSLWGDSEIQMLVWAKQNPTSVRAQQSAAIALYKRGDYIQTLKLLEAAAERIPDSFIIRLQHMIYLCQGYAIDNKLFGRWLSSIEQIPHNFMNYTQTSEFIRLITTNQCKGVTLQDGHRFLDMLSRKQKLKKFRSAKRQLAHLHGVLYTHEQLPEKALASFRESQRIYPDVESGLLSTAILATHGYYAYALDMLNTAEASLGKMPNKRLKRNKSIYEKEIFILRRKILANMNQR